MSRSPFHVSAFPYGDTWRPVEQWSFPRVVCQSLAGGHSSATSFPHEPHSSQPCLSLKQQHEAQLVPQEDGKGDVFSLFTR